LAKWVNSRAQRRVNSPKRLSEKLRNYQQLPNLTQVLIVSHCEARVTSIERGDGGTWTTRECRAGESVPLGCIGNTLAVDEIYGDGFEDSP
jgi:Uma2 family endonuclease